MSADPFELFERYYAEAAASEPEHANAMALSTVGSDRQPSARIVLLKGHDPRGFVFYSNIESRKALEIVENSKVALLFHWRSLERQARVEGTATMVSGSESDEYFFTRDRESQIGAWASKQSCPLDSRHAFEERLEAVRRRFEGQPVTRPPHWAGYRVEPTSFEFWQGRAHRLHERRTFMWSGECWREGLLYP